MKRMLVETDNEHANIYDKEVKPGIKTGVLVKSFLAFIVAVSLVTFATRLMKYNELQTKKELLNKEIMECQEEINKLEYDIAAPMDDEYIIRVAKEKLNLYFPDEIIYYNDIINP